MPARRALGARCTQDSRNRTERHLLDCCVLSAARPRPLFAFSRPPVGARAAVVTRVLLCLRTNATIYGTLTLRTLESSIHPATAAAYTRQLAAFLELLVPSYFTASQTEALHQLPTRRQYHRQIPTYTPNTNTRPSRHGAVLHFQAAFQRLSPHESRPGRPRNS